MSARRPSGRGAPKGGGSSRGGPPKRGAPKAGGGRGRGSSSSPRSSQGQRPRARRNGGERGTTPIRSGNDGATRKRSLGGDQVEGRQAVRELLLAQTRRVTEVVLASDLDEADILDDIIDLADEQKVTLREIGRNRFDGMAATGSAQGVLAMAAPLREHDLEELAVARDGRPPFLLIVDGVTDPGNLGALLRTAECSGVTGVVLPRHRAARITPTVTKSAAGAVEHLPMAVVSGIPTALRMLSENGVWSVGLDGAAGDSLYDLTLANEPVALVLGSEGTGLSRLVRERCDTVVSIPLRGMLSSLNVAAAGAIACSEIARRR